MKKILTVIITLILLTATAYAQKLPDQSPTKVRINEPDKTIVAEIDDSETHAKPKSALNYYWYSAGSIHTTQGGYSGILLNGSYTVYYPNKNLEEQGIFKKGLKDGIWKTWKDDGTLNPVTTWKKG